MQSIKLPVYHSKRLILYTILILDADKVVAKWKQVGEEIEIYRKLVLNICNIYFNSVFVPNFTMNVIHSVYAFHFKILGHCFQKDNVDQLHQQSLALHTKILELQKSPFARSKQHEVLENLEKL